MSSSFQSILLELQEPWAGKDCLVWQPCNAKVGAGMMHPAAFLRVPGPERLNAACVEPSARSNAGRCGIPDVPLTNVRVLAQHERLEKVREIVNGSAGLLEAAIR